MQHILLKRKFIRYIINGYDSFSKSKDKYDKIQTFLFEIQIQENYTSQNEDANELKKGAGHTYTLHYNILYNIINLNQKKRRAFRESAKINRKRIQIKTKDILPFDVSEM